MVAALVVLLFFSKSESLPSSIHLPEFATDLVGGGQRLQIAVLETKGWHDEVSASFFSAFGQLPECQVDGFLAKRRFGIDAIYAQLPGSQKRVMKDSNDMIKDIEHVMKSGDQEMASRLNEKYNPDVVLSITSDFDMVDRKLYFTYLLEHTECVVFAVVHHPDDWKTSAHLKAAKPWIEANRLRFITLSAHVSAYMEAAVLKKWSKDVDTTNVIVSTFPPVFTVASHAPSSTQTSAQSSKLGFALQGELIRPRKPNRDYDGTFKRFAKLLGGANGDSLELRVLGNGKIPKVPIGAEDAIKFFVALPYTEFYAVLQDATALLPAFASADYMRNKASSTIPASFVVGVPLIAGDDLLEAYTFVDREDVYYRAEGEDEIDVIARIASMPEADRLEKSENVRRKNERLVKESSILMRDWVRESLDML